MLTQSHEGSRQASAAPCSTLTPATRTPPPLSPCSLDTSAFMRNGDYTPSRLDAQYDAAVLLCDAKIEDHPESTVGILTMGGKR
jgi:hypothetical protein